MLLKETLAVTPLIVVVSNKVLLPKPFAVPLFDPTSTTDYKNILFRGVYADTSNQAIVVYGGGSFDGEGTTAINNFKIQPSSGGFDAGVFKLYGVS